MAVAVVWLAVSNQRLKAEAVVRSSIEKNLKELADTDFLTKLLNRRAFNEKYTDELARAKRYDDVFSIIILDIDFFKQVNDNHGHPIGDRVIQRVAELLQANSRESDACGQFGGEEFILLLPKTSVEEAKQYATRLCRSIRENKFTFCSGHSISISASIGVAAWAPEDDGDMTIVKADKALYRAKTSGRDKVVVWAPDNLFFSRHIGVYRSGG